MDRKAIPSLIYLLHTSFRKRKAMPSVQAPATVLVTGASGFIGTWLVKDLLERGYSVRVAYVIDIQYASVIDNYLHCLEKVSVPLNLPNSSKPYPLNTRDKSLIPSSKISSLCVDLTVRIKTLGTRVAHNTTSGQDNAFDDAVKGVDAVLHLATPVTPFLSASVKAQGASPHLVCLLINNNDVSISRRDRTRCCGYYWSVQEYPAICVSVILPFT